MYGYPSFWRLELLELQGLRVMCLYICIGRLELLVELAHIDEPFSRVAFKVPLRLEALLT